MRSNDSYAWTSHGSGTTSTTSNGRNQIASWVNTLSYDTKGNVTADGTYTYGYSSENLLTSLTNSASGALQPTIAFAYDPLMRLAVIDSSNAAFDVDFGYDGMEMVLEGLSSSRTRRYVYGPGGDEPLVGYLVTSTGTSRLWYQADERGSITRLSNDSGTPGGTGKYDEYGVGGTSRFRYTGQYWLGEANLLYYRARIYDARLGRFLQPDPIRYGSGMNLYAYVRGDPVNLGDPLGLAPGECADGHCEDTFVGLWLRMYNGFLGEGGSSGRYEYNMVNIEGGSGSSTCTGGDPSCEITVTGPRPTRELLSCEADFAGRQFTLGMSWDLRHVEFRYGRDDSTNLSSHKALDSGAGAVTQYSVIYVNPNSWERITNPDNDAFWEEIFHTTQFSKYGSLFYIRYGASSVAARTRGEDIYYGNAFEREAKEWASMLALKYRETKPCAN